MIGIVVVTWNSADVIGRCLDACLRLSDVEVVVVDNASSDCTADVVRERAQVRLIANRENIGFAAGVNRGVEALEHRSILLLNPDAAPLSELSALASAVLQLGVGAAGGQLLGEDGAPQDGFNVRGFPSPWTLVFEVLGLNRILPWNIVNRRYRQSVTEAADVDQPAGAFLMLNREAWQSVGGFDEDFWPAWFEDVDFCWRLRMAGFRVVYVPQATACHVGGHSANHLSWDSRQLFWYGSLLRYAAKRFSPGGRRLVAAAVMLASIPRGAAGIVGQGRLAAGAVYSKVFRLALSYWRKSRRISHLAVS